jgi:hypothetical protein
VVTIALVGPVSSGKSIYIAVLIHELTRFFDKKFGCTFEPAEGTDTADHYNAWYEAALRESRNLRSGETNLLGGTARENTAAGHQRNALVYRFGKRIGQDRKQAAYLVLRDTAGDDLEDLGQYEPPQDGQLGSDGLIADDLEHVSQGELAQTDLSLLGRADGLVFLVDPLHESVVKRLLGRLIPTGIKTGGDPDIVLKAVERIVGHRQPERLMFAVAITKFDSLHLLETLDTDVEWQAIMSNPGSAFRRDAQRTSIIHRSDGNTLAKGSGEDGKLLHFELVSLLQRLNSRFYNKLNELGWQYTLFAVSALGSMPQSKTRKSPRGMTPFRCLDPVLWILASCWDRAGFFTSSDSPPPKQPPGSPERRTPNPARAARQAKRLVKVSRGWSAVNLLLCLSIYILIGIRGTWTDLIPFYSKETSVAWNLLLVSWPLMCIGLTIALMRPKPGGWIVSFASITNIIVVISEWADLAKTSVTVICSAIETLPAVLKARLCASSFLIGQTPKVAATVAALALPCTAGLLAIVSAHLRKRYEPNSSTHES